MSPEFAEFECFLGDYQYTISAISACFFIEEHRTYLSSCLPWSHIFIFPHNVRVPLVCCRRLIFVSWVCGDRTLLRSWICPKLPLSPSLCPLLLAHSLLLPAGTCLSVIPTQSFGWLSSASSTYGMFFCLVFWCADTLLTFPLQTICLVFCLLVQ